MQIQIQSGYQILEIDFRKGSCWGFPIGESRRRHCNVDKTNTKNTQTVSHCLRQDWRPPIVIQQ